MKNLRNTLSTLSNIDRDDVLDSLGLERKHGTAEQIVPALALFGAGVLVGVGLGMIFAPKAGAELRGELESQLKRVEAKVRGNGGTQPAAAAPVSNRPA